MPGKVSPRHTAMVEALLANDGALLGLTAHRLVTDLTKVFRVGRSAAWTAVERAREARARRVHSGP